MAGINADYTAAQKKGNWFSNLNNKYSSWAGGESFLGGGITNGALVNAGMGALNMGVNMLAGQNQSGVGNALQTIGGLASNIPGVGGLIGAGVGVVGGLVNAAFGSHINDEFVQQTQLGANQIGSQIFNANTNGDLLNDWQNMAQMSNVSKSEVGSDGWFSNKASRKTRELNRQIDEANQRQLANFSIAAENVDTQNDLRILQNMAAYGGPINSFRKYYSKGGYLSQAKALIRQNEGWRDKPYSDAPKGKNWRSVGYGFNDSGFRDKYPEGISKHYEHGITKKQAEEELDYFLNKAEKQLKSIYGKQWNDFTDSQKAAILDTYYQRPASVGKSSRFYKAVTAGEDAGKYLGVSGYNKRNKVRQDIFGGGYSGYGDWSDAESDSNSPSLQEVTPFTPVVHDLDLSGITPTEAKALELNLTSPTFDLSMFGKPMTTPTQQAVPIVGTVEDFLASYGDFEENLFKEGGMLGNYFEGEGEEPNSLKVERSPHIDLAFNNPWLYNKLHPKQKKREKYTPATFAGRVAQVSGAKDKTIKYVDYNSSLAQTIPYVGTAISALDLGYDLNKLSHDATLANSKDVALDAASLLPQLRRTMKGSWLKGNSGTFITDTGQMLYNPRVASALEVALQPYRAIINGAGYTGKLADMVDDSKEFLLDMYNESPIGKYFNEGKKADGGELNIKDMNIFDFGGGLTHGVTFDTGVDWVNEGKSHEQNPYGGVMVGSDEEGIPNLVEEDEAIWNGDYVFSRRMKVPKKLREKYHLKDDATFADAVKKLTKDSEERPLDNISRRTQDHILGEFADSQEELRASKAQRAMEKEQQLQEDFLTGVQFGLGGALFADGGGIHIDPSKRGFLFDNSFAYGGPFGNVFAGEGNKANRLSPEESTRYLQALNAAQQRSIIASLFGDDSPITRTVERIGEVVEDPIGYFAGDQIDAIMNRVAQMSQPQMEKFFSTSLGQAVAKGVVEADKYLSSGTGDNMQKAGVNRWYKATGRMAKPVYQATVNAAKRAMAQSKQIARGQMKTPKGGGSQKVLNETMTPTQAARQATTGSTEGLPQGWNLTKSNTPTMTTESIVQGPNVRGARFSGRTTQTSRVNPKSTTGRAAASRGTAPDPFAGLEGTLNMRAPIGSGNFGYLPWALGAAGVGGAGYGLYKGLDWLAEGLTNPDGTINGVNDPVTQAAINSLPPKATSNRGNNTGQKAEIKQGVEQKAGTPKRGKASTKKVTFTPTKPNAAYDWDEFFNTINNYNGSLKEGNIKGNYAVDPQFNLGEFSNVKALEDNEDYRNFTDRVVKTMKGLKGTKWRRKDRNVSGKLDNLEVVGADGKPRQMTEEEYTTLRYLEAASNRTPDSANTGMFEYVGSGPDRYNSLNDNAINDFIRYRTDGNLGVYHLNPTYKMPELADPTSITDFANSIAPVQTDTNLPEQGLLLFDPKLAGDAQRMVNGTRSVTDENGIQVTRVTDDNPTDGRTGSFRPKQTWTRYAPLVMSGLMGLKEMLTPADYGNADSIMEAAYQVGSPVSIGTEYLGDYRKRDPFDERYLMNLINQRGAATNRNMMNLSGGNRAAAMAGILSNDLTTQMSLAEAARQSYLANRADDAQVAEFNRGTNQFNATAQNQRNQFLAGLNSQRQQAMLSGISQGARLRQAIKDQRDAAISANLTNLAQGLGDLGKENGFYNMLGGLNEEGVLKYFYGDNWKTMFNNNQQNV